jgi:hypothetical protein
MRSALIRSSAIGALLLAVTLALSACDDDSTGPGTSVPTLENIWPNQDGRSWSFKWVRAGSETGPATLYSTPDEVPTIPSFDDAYALLIAPDPPDLQTDIDGFFELEFAGNDTTASGATGQLLKETAFLESPEFGFMTLDPKQILLSHLHQRRPDLRSRIESILPKQGPPQVLVTGPLLLHGGAFERTESHIGTYGDLDQDLAWKFLEADLSIGHEFSFPLVPSLASDVVLHAQVRNSLSTTIAGRSYRNCLEVLYVVDFGVAAYIPPTGGVSGYYRLFDVGTILYAPGLGPVQSEERNGISTSLEAPAGWGVHRLELRPDQVPDADGLPESPTLENIWPNSNHDSWTYRSQALTGETRCTVCGPADPPLPLPPLQELYDWFDGPPPVTESARSEIYLRLQFDGMLTTDSGATGQNLRETFWYPQETSFSSRPVEPEVVFLRHLLQARPELRARAGELWPRATRMALDDLPSVAASATDAPAKQPTMFSAVPLLLFGYAWEKTDQYIGTYGDVDQLLAWKFLEADLSVGHAFSHQLVPSLASDVWLHVRVWETTDLKLGGEVYRDCLEVFYVVDMGWQVRTDEMGNESGGFRSFAAGIVVYAPGVGPIACRERIELGPSAFLSTSETALLIDRYVNLMEARIGATREPRPR